MQRSMSVLALPIFFIANCFVDVSTVNSNMTDDAEEASEMGQSTLRYVWMLTRHGSRSPIATYSGDPYPFDNTQFWPNGIGQLTKLGIQQMYAVGLLLRERYDGFLSANYYPDEIFVESTYYNRDLMSAEAILAGLYPPVGFQIWNENLAWQPIPVFQLPFDICDIPMYPNICPRYYELYQQLLGKPNPSLDPELANILKYFLKITGQDYYESIMELLLDSLLVQAENGFELPAWAAKVPLTLIKALRGFECFTTLTQTNEQVRLLAGPVLAVISERLFTKAAGTMDPDLKMYIQANHEAIIYGILRALNIKEVNFVDMSAFIAFELHENSDGHFVKVLYYKNAAIPLVLDLPFCKNPCSLEGFYDAVKNYIPEDWNSECHSKATRETSAENNT